MLRIEPATPWQSPNKLGLCAWLKRSLVSAHGLNAAFRLCGSLLHHTSYILHLTSYILHHTSYILHHTSYILHHTSYIFRLFFSPNGGFFLCCCLCFASKGLEWHDHVVGKCDWMYTLKACLQKNISQVSLSVRSERFLAAKRHRRRPESTRGFLRFLLKIRLRLFTRSLAHRA